MYIALKKEKHIFLMFVYYSEKMKDSLFVLLIGSILSCTNENYKQ